MYRQKTLSENDLAAREARNAVREYVRAPNSKGREGDAATKLSEETASRT